MSARRDPFCHVLVHPSLDACPRPLLERILAEAQKVLSGLPDRTTDALSLIAESIAIGCKLKPKARR